MVSPPASLNVSLSGLEEKGRGIYFYHDENSDLPVRDVTGQGKKEPYIEYGTEHGLDEEHVVGAENYCYECYPAAIRKFLESDEKYLFLLTTPQNRDLSRQVVGYIRKDNHEVRDEDRYVVIGKTELYSFEDSIPVTEFGKPTSGPLGKYGQLFDGDETAAILDHFDGCTDVTEECLQEVQRLERDGE